MKCDVHGVEGCNANCCQIWKEEDIKKLAKGKAKRKAVYSEILNILADMKEIK